MPSAQSSSVAKLPKPQLRGLLASATRNNFVIGFALASAASLSVWYFMARQRKINYREFYKNYDADKEYERMKATGIVFKCV